MDVKLVLFKPNGQRKEIPVNGEVTVIGRGEDCDLQVPLQSVSRRHCQLTVRGQDLTVKDLGSANGTYVNGERVNTAELDAGDRLAVGPLIVTIQIDGVPKDIQQVVTPEARAVRASVEAEDDDAVVNLEADMLLDDDDEVVDLDVTEDVGGDKLDPIAALEALAAENEKKDEKTP